MCGTERGIDVTPLRIGTVRTVAAPPVPAIAAAGTITPIAMLPHTAATLALMKLSLLDAASLESCAVRAGVLGR